LIANGLYIADVQFCCNQMLLVGIVQMYRLQKILLTYRGLLFSENSVVYFESTLTSTTI